MKKIAAVTMARNDAFFLRKWMAYYGEQLGSENLYVYLDGEDQTLPFDTGKVHVMNQPKIQGNVVQLDRERSRLLSALAKELFQEYDLVIGCDADEFLVVDPALEQTLAQYLSGLTIPTSISALGLDVGQHLLEEKPIQEGLPFLQQRSYAWVCQRYTKAVVLGKPLSWGSGFHRVKGHDFYIQPDLYLFHFGSFDDARIQARFSDADRMKAGWEKHLNKRRRTIQYVTEISAKEADHYLPLARKFQQYIRQPYAWNKPCMAWWKLVVKIPTRFRNVL